MQQKSAILVVMLVAATIAACGPGPILVPSASPSPAREWKVKLTQSGGIAGVMHTTDVDSDGNLHAADARSGRSVTSQLPADAVDELGQLVADLGSTPATPLPSACADCFIYDLDVTVSGSTLRFHADDTTLAASRAGALITYLRQLWEKALAVQN